MSRIAYVNGRYLPQREASVNIEDRGYQFADGIYEVVHMHAGRLVDSDRHFDRLDRSLREIRLPLPMSRATGRHIRFETARRNRVREGLLYMQVTRGVARRGHASHEAGVPVGGDHHPPYSVRSDRRDDMDGEGDHPACSALGAAT
jgi:D-alanine transaminase